jgi:SanA protein
MLKRRIVTVVLLLTVIPFLAIYLCDQKIQNAAEGKLYTKVSTIPFNKTCLLLGTGKYLAGGQKNPYYHYRIKAATELIKKGKAKYIIISGDNRRVEYNEPQEMKEDLIHEGIDSCIIYLDYAGFRTFDSMVRLKKVFGQTSVTVISQQFHNQRALYIASREGINAIGYNATDVGNTSGLRVQVREKLARVKVFVDYFFGNEPKFLGEKISIPS